MTKFAPSPALIAGLLSFSLLAGAFAFQYIGGLDPCALCIWQRWPHGIIILASGLWLFSKNGFKDLATGLGVCAALASLILAGWHSGVELGVLQGLSQCGTDIDPTLSLEEMQRLIQSDGIASCDKVDWQFLRLSMANWNALFSITLVGLWGHQLYKG